MSNINLLFVFNCLILSAIIVTVKTECFVPPLECPNVNVTFWLYTQANENNPHELSLSNPESLKTAPWVDNQPIKILIHGYTGYRDFTPNTFLRPAYLSRFNYNLISLDYGPLVKEPCYIQAAQNTELAGKCTAQLIDELVGKYQFSLSRFHVIGFSLGGQTAGYVGTYVTSGVLDRITGLDPALPLFVTPDNKKKLDKSDAKFVDVLHTNVLVNGKLEPSGHVDFYSRGGFNQPGCKSTQNDTSAGCSHNRAPMYYAESITTDVGFYAKKCSSWITYLIGWCELFKSSDEILFGEYVPLDAEGLYFFTTNDESPYARGHQSDTKPNK